jgi:hypothetical protein
MLVRTCGKPVLTRLRTHFDAHVAPYPMLFQLSSSTARTLVQPEEVRVSQNETEDSVEADPLLLAMIASVLMGEPIGACGLTSISMPVAMQVGSTARNELYRASTTTTPQSVAAQRRTLRAYEPTNDGSAVTRRSRSLRPARLGLKGVLRSQSAGVGGASFFDSLMLR